MLQWPSLSIRPGNFYFFNKYQPKIYFIKNENKTKIGKKNKKLNTLDMTF